MAARAVGRPLATATSTLRSVTIAGSGFTALDTQRWYLVIGPSTIQTVVTDFSQLGTYPMVGGNIVISLGYALSLWPTYQLAALTQSNATTGTLSMCFTHGNTASNCLALSYAYAAPNQPLPIAPPTAGFVTNSSLSVLSVTGCRTNYANNGSSTDCNPNTYTTLTMVGSGFPSPSQLYITVGLVRCIQPLTTRGAAANTAISCSIPAEYSALQFNQWLPVVVTDMIGLQQSPPSYLVQYSSPAHPTITSVTGCEGDSINSASLTTTGCTLSTTVTITGSGFVQDGTQWRLSVTLAGSTTAVNQLGISTYLVNSSSIQLPTSLLYSIIAPSITSTSSVVSLYIRHDTWLVGPVQITVPTSPLSVSRVSGCAAAANANFTVVGCSPGVSSITIQGVSFLSTTTVTVANQPCVLTTYTATSLVCVLPTPVGLQPGVAYDLYISNFAGNVTVPGGVSYTTSPTIVSVTSLFCPPDYAWTGNGNAPLFCSAYAQLTLVGVYFQELSTLQVNITSLYFALPPLTCGNLSYLSASELTCTLPAPGSLSPQSPQSIQIWENSTFASNSWQTRLYTDTTQQPNIESVQGCVSVDAATRVASGCQVGDIITLNGANFVPGTTTLQVQLWSDGEAFQCSSPRVLSSTQLTCTLPYLPLLSVDSVLPIRISNMASMQSNWLVAINFNAASTSQSSSNMRFIVSLAVLIPLVAVLLVIIAFMLGMRRASGDSGKHSGNEQHTQGSGSGWSRHSDEKEVESGLQMSGVSVDTYSNEQ